MPHQIPSNAIIDHHDYHSPINLPTATNTPSTTNSTRRRRDEAYDNHGYVPIATTNVDGRYYNTVITSTDDDIFYTTLV